ncbi:MAG: diacylglycerol/lipid kinase family protein [Solirubrobacteraceae bacterium]
MSGVTLIVNPAAGGGRGRELADAVEQRLRSLGLEVARTLADGVEHAREVGAEAATSGRTIALLGGDGLIGAVADAARASSGATLALLPCGSGNDLARVLGVPLEPLAACELVASGRRVAIDLGEVSSMARGGDGENAKLGAGRAFVGIASFGFDSDANRLANEAPRRLGSLIYAYGALRALATWRDARFTLAVDGGEAVSFSGYSVGAANSSTYGGGMRAVPAARLDDGQLDLVYVESMSRLRFLTRVLPKVFSGTHVRERGVHELRGRELSLSADRPFVVYADGDPIATLPVRVRALPAAIGVLVSPARAAAWAR